MDYSADIPESLETLLQGSLHDGETVHFKACPVPAQVMRRSLPLAYVTMPALLALFYWAATSDSPTLVMGLLILIALAVIILLRPIWLYQVARRTLYAVSNESALVITSAPFHPTTKRFDAADIKGRHFKRFEDHSGSIFFNSYSKQGFVGLPDVNNAETALQVLEQKAVD